MQRMRAMIKRKLTAFEAELIDLLAFETEYGEDDVPIEVLCRKLHKHGLIEKTDGLWVLDVNQTEPKGESDEDL